MTAREPMEAAMFPQRQEGGEVAAGRAAMPVFPGASFDTHETEMAAALTAVAALRKVNDALADALTSCLVRLEDLGEGDGPTADYARAALRRAWR